jgi:hypothetical protein
VLALAAALGAAGVVSLRRGNERTHQIVKAHPFELTDGSGNVRALWGDAGGQAASATGIVFCDGRGGVRLGLVVGRADPALPSLIQWVARRPK